jgi:hypothetical protein
MISIIDKKEARKIYMREYMKQRYNDNPIKVKNYNNSNKCKNKLNLPMQDLNTYGEYLADIVKLRKIIQKIPEELLNKCLIENLVF